MSKPVDAPGPTGPATQPFPCPVCGEQNWREDYYQAVHQGVTLVRDADGSIYAEEYHGDEETYDDGSTSAESFKCQTCRYEIRGASQGSFCVLGHDGFGMNITVPDEIACADCGGSKTNIQGCPSCCRDCGFPCAIERGWDGFHIRDEEPDPDEDEDRGLACDDVSPATPGELEDDRAQR